MADINKVILVGRLTRDAEIKYSAGGIAIGSFSVAVNRRKKVGEQWVEEVSYFDVSLFGKSAENLNQYLIKGKQIAIDGELRQDRWEKDGQKFSKVVIVANSVQLLGGNPSGGTASSGYNPSGGSARRDNTSSQSSRPAFQPKQNNPVDDYSDAQSFDGDSDFPEEIPF